VDCIVRLTQISVKTCAETHVILTDCRWRINDPDRYLKLEGVRHFKLQSSPEQVAGPQRAVWPAKIEV
jgi:hypothetical protein